MKLNRYQKEYWFGTFPALLALGCAAIAMCVGPNCRGNELTINNETETVLSVTFRDSAPATIYRTTVARGDSVRMEPPLGAVSANFFVTTFAGTSGTEATTWLANVDPYTFDFSMGGDAVRIRRSTTANSLLLTSVQYTPTQGHLLITDIYAVMLAGLMLMLTPLTLVIAFRLANRGAGTVF